MLDVGFNREVAEDSALYWNKEVGNLALLINKVDGLSTEKIQKLGEISSKRIQNTYSWEIICKKYKKIFIEWRQYDNQ